MRDTCWEKCGNNIAPWRGQCGKQCTMTEKIWKTMRGSCNVRTTLCFHVLQVCMFTHLFPACVIFPAFPACFPTFFLAVFGTISCPGHSAPHRRSHSREQSLRRKRRHKHSLATQAQTQLHRHKPKHYAGRTPRGAQRRYGKKKVHPGRERGSVRFAAFPFSFLLSEGICHHHSPKHPPLQCCPCSLKHPHASPPRGGNKDTACPEGKNV